MADATIKKATYSPSPEPEGVSIGKLLRSVPKYMMDVLTPGKIESPQDAIIRKATGDVHEPDPAPTPDTRRDMIAEQIKNAPPDRYEVYMAKQKAEDKAKAAAK